MLRPPMTDSAYHPESYWTAVADQISQRTAQRDVATSDDPYYRYKRDKFLMQFLMDLRVAGRTVAEIGCGPGGNLLRLLGKQPACLIGVDISQAMLDLAAVALGPHRSAVGLFRTEGERIPLPTRSVDTALTVTVLMHNIEPTMFRGLVAELCRISRDEVVIIESTAPREETGPSWTLRPVSTYQDAFAPQDFRLAEPPTYLGLRASRTFHYLCSRLLDRDRPEGTPVPRAMWWALRLGLGVTAITDRLLTDRRDLTRMVFKRH